MRILYIQSTSEIGGSDITLLRTIEHLDRSRFTPFVVLPKPGPLMSAFQAAGAHTLVVPMRKLTRRAGIGHHMRYAIGYVPTALALRRLVRQFEIDAVHTNTMHSLYGWLAAYLAGRPHLWHVREITYGPPPIRALELALIPRFSSRIVVMSEAIASMFGRPGHRPPQLVKVYDGIDLEAFHPRVKGERIRAALGIDASVPLVGIVCRLDRWKGVDVFLHAAAGVLQRFPNARFLIAGGPIEGHESYEAELRQLAGRLGIAPSVIFAGWRFRHRDVPEVLAALDLVVHASTLPEPYGLSVIEAMAMSKALVATEIGGPAELAGSRACRLIPARDAHAMAEAICTLLADPALRGTLGRAGRARAEELFDVRDCVRKMELVYEDAVAEWGAQLPYARWSGQLSV